MATLFKKFRLPLDGDLSDLKGQNERVCVIGLFGASTWGHDSKTGIVNDIISNHAFPPLTVESLSNSEEEEEACYIEAFYDGAKSIMYLHLVSVYDAAMLCMLSEEASCQLKEPEYHAMWMDFEHLYCRALIYMFSFCHIMICIQPTATFDPSYIRLFRILDNIRIKIADCLKDHISDIPGVSDNWSSTGRPCTPRMLFVYQSCPFTKQEIDASIYPSNDYHKCGLLKKLQSSLEDQIYKALRRSGVATNISANCLFTIPANQEFVHIMYDMPNKSPTQILLCLLQETFENGCVGPSKPTTGAKMLRKFVNEHTSLVTAGEGFNDNLGRTASSSPVPFDIPNLTCILAVSAKLYELLIEDVEEGEIQNVVNRLRSVIDADMKFSENRCNKVLPHAMRAYQENLPSHYISAVHNKHLTHAVRIFSQHARGPAYYSYLEQLKGECLQYWESGKQLCEVRSLTGQHCVHQRHVLPSDPKEGQPNLQVMHHNSRARFTSSCNCGNTQVYRDDPFDLETANYIFYQELEAQCCSNSIHERHLLPVFQSSRESGQVHNPALNVTLETAECYGMVSTLSIQPELSLSQTVLHELSLNSQVEKGKENPPDIQREVSTTEYLPFLLNTESPKGLLPLFPSWSLITLYPTHRYNPNVGIDQPGFFIGTNYLLSWWVAASNSGGQPSVDDLDPQFPVLGRDLKRTKKQFREETVTPVVFVGLEYECSRGHRFFIVAPEKAMNCKNPRELWDTPDKILHSDIPIYQPCAAWTQKAHLAQLMRIYIGIPDNLPGVVVLKPEVIFSKLGPTYIIHSDQAITLPGGHLWVMRLPFIYASNHRHVLPPKDNQPVVLGCIKKDYLVFKSSCIPLVR